MQPGLLLVTHTLVAMGPACPGPMAATCLIPCSTATLVCARWLLQPLSSHHASSRTYMTQNVGRCRQHGPLQHSAAGGSAKACLTRWVHLLGYEHQPRMTLAPATTCSQPLLLCHDAPQHSMAHCCHAVQCRAVPQSVVLACATCNNTIHVWLQLAKLAL